ncbi:hypothetical protein [Urechidicola vernalis]|uniref:Uncharacterized protein n=1 Tax=Urechidicola vernalis TaxID=3075600 RepID=A0ABU2Y614_9FLAO|nr:hypothetical protein [Urechidicola sp. P050]MDT0553644.1 hypothetical protein [Urechidicola sp. P050]
MAFSIFKYVMLLFLGLVVGFGLHLVVLNYMELELFENRIILAYSLNFCVAALIVGGLFIVREKQKDNLGSLFMIGSFLKFALFFIAFYPSYTSDGEMTKQEFFTFFIPYIISLILETLALIRLLEYLDFYTSKYPQNKDE